MTSVRRSCAVGALAALALLPAEASGQFFDDATTGQFYRVEAAMTVGRTFAEVRIERVAPHAIAPPAPLAPLRLPVPLGALTGQIIELPERQRLYVAGLDARGTARLMEIDLLGRQIREVAPRAGAGPAYAVRMLAAPDAAKLYVAWYASAVTPATDIYDGNSLVWLGDTVEFAPDERAAGFEHQPPYLWTLDGAGRPLLLDTDRDRVVRSFDYRRWLGPHYGVVADAWRDLLLVRLDLGHDRYQVVDVVSGEIGPPLDLEGIRQAQPRLALAGRLLVLIDMERRPPRRARWSETAIALGGGAIYDLRAGGRVDEFQLIVPPNLPAFAVGTHADPTAPGRLWIYVPGDDQRLDFDLPACDFRAPRGDAVRAELVGRWGGAGDPTLYRYRLAVAASSPAAVGALAIRAGRESERTSKPEGWGVDLIDRDRWVRWTNGLGPAADDVAPDSIRGGFVIAADSETRPGIAEYRVQAAIGLPRGCESDDRFLDNSIAGYTIAPERVDTDDPRKLARRLAEIVEQACEIGWAGEGDCPRLIAAAEALESSKADRHAAAQLFRDALAGADLNDSAAAVLSDAAAAVEAALESSS